MSRCGEDEQIVCMSEKTPGDDESVQRVYKYIHNLYVSMYIYGRLLKRGWALAR